MSWLFRNFRFKLLALAVALLLWGVSHTAPTIERGFDLPVELEDVPESLVVTSESSDAVNIRVRGSQAALRRFAAANVNYSVDLSGAKPGVTEVEVDITGLDPPRGAEVVSRSPLTLDFTLERRGTKSVKVRADVEGQPAAGHEVAAVRVRPPRVRITGARSEVLRLSEVLTETVDVTGVTEPLERTVKPSLRARNVWIAKDQPQEVTVEVDVRSTEPAETEETG